MDTPYYQFWTAFLATVTTIGIGFIVTQIIDIVINLKILEALNRKDKK